MVILEVLVCWLLFEFRIFFARVCVPTPFLQKLVEGAILFQIATEAKSVMPKVVQQCRN